MGRVDVVCEGFDGKDSNDLNNSYEGTKGEDTEEDELLALGELEFEEHREGCDDTVAEPPISLA